MALDPRQHAAAVDPQLMGQGMDTAVVAVDPAWFQFPAAPTEPTSGNDPLAHLDAAPVITNPVGRAALERAAHHLVAESQVISMPTETVYGLAGNALDARGVARIFAAKQRPSDNPLIVHVASLAMLRALLPGGEIPKSHVPLMQRFWPGPLTLLFPAAPGVLPPTVTAGQPTVAVRFPAHPVARALIAVAGVPLAAPSANSSGRPSPTLAEHVKTDLSGRIPLILDAGQCDCGLESTVVAVTPNPVVLRPGGVTVETLRGVPGFERIVCHSGHVEASAVPEAPGMKYRHYSPTAPVHLLLQPTAGAVREQIEAIRGDSNLTAVVGWVRTVDTVAADAWLEAAVQSGSVLAFDAREDPNRELFRALRWLDERGVAGIVVEGTPEEHLGRAFMNRVKKAASVVVS
ncbi:hypothetical protein H9P43_003570 [Blastocladiella emersonii ATCC 22665]|nr:hypothetical protein H9P43_003570 [Blastocladiella emersonii ATCC 22665]